MIEYGYAGGPGGVTPGKGGSTHLERPVFQYRGGWPWGSTGANVSIIFCSPGLLPAMRSWRRPEAGIATGDLYHRGASRCRIWWKAKKLPVGKEYPVDRPPTCSGCYLRAGECKVGIMPGFVFQERGRSGIVSKFGYADLRSCLTRLQGGAGASPRPVGIGGDPIIGTADKKRRVELLMNDPETEGIVMIRGDRWKHGSRRRPVGLKENNRKARGCGLFAGQTAPPRARRMGPCRSDHRWCGRYCGSAKMKIMAECGITVVADACGDRFDDGEGV